MDAMFRWIEFVNEIRRKNVGPHCYMVCLVNDFFISFLVDFWLFAGQTTKKSLINDFKPTEKLAFMPKPKGYYE